jgi:hypothetical protein
MLAECSSFISRGSIHILCVMCSRDGNGDPIPDSPWGIPLLGDGYGINLVPAGI